MGVAFRISQLRNSVEEVLMVDMAYDDVTHKREMCDCNHYYNMMVYFFFHTLYL